MNSGRTRTLVAHRDCILLTKHLNPNDAALQQQCHLCLFMQVILPSMYEHWRSLGDQDASSDTFRTLLLRLISLALASFSCQ